MNRTRGGPTKHGDQIGRTLSRPKLAICFAARFEDSRFPSQGIPLEVLNRIGAGGTAMAIPDLDHGSLRSPEASIRCNPLTVISSM